MEKKYEYVQSWLEMVFAGQEVPPWEVNTQTVDHLYSLARQCEEKETQAKLEIADLQQKTKEYEAETARLKAQTDWLGVTMADLSPTAASCLKSLAESALALGIKDCSDTSFCLALSRLTVDGATDNGQKEQLLRKLTALREELKSLVLKQAAQKKMLSQLSSEMKERRVTMEKQKKETVFLQQKSEQYQRQVAAMKTELEEQGYDPSLSHGALLEGASEVKEIQQQLDPLKAQLASYKDLPPDLDLARVKVEEARRKLMRLEAELSTKVDLVHVEK